MNSDCIIHLALFRTCMTTQVFEETLRLYGSGVLHRLVPKGGLDLHGYHVPEGTWVMVSGVHVAVSCAYAGYSFIII